MEILLVLLYFTAPQLTNLFVFQLDIVQQNYISPENLKQPLCVTEVTGAAFDSGGTWLATAEYWNDGIMSPEIRLKFWQFNEKKQRYYKSGIMTKPVFGVSDQVQHKSGCKSVLVMWLKWRCCVFV